MSQKGQSVVQMTYTDCTLTHNIKTRKPRKLLIANFKQNRHNSKALMCEHTKDNIALKYLDNGDNTTTQTNVPLQKFSLERVNFPRT